MTYLFIYTYIDYYLILNICYIILVHKKTKCFNNHLDKTSKILAIYL